MRGAEPDMNRTSSAATPPHFIADNDDKPLICIMLFDKSEAASWA